MTDQPQPVPMPEPEFPEEPQGGVVGKTVASYLIRVTVRDSSDASDATPVAPAGTAAVEGAVEKAMTDLIPGTTANARAERLDR